jgi:hypothetical protein
MTFEELQYHIYIFQLLLAAIALGLASISGALWFVLIVERE